MRNTHAALEWIVRILRELDIKFEIDGGLAALVYGSERELADIDLNVEDKNFDKLVKKINNFITFGPEWYKDENWDLYMISLRYAGQNIDIGVLGKMRYFDKKENKWNEMSSNLSDVRMMEYDGLTLPFVNEIKLLIYKEGLNRGVDKKDVKAMEEQLESEWKI